MTTDLDAESHELAKVEALAKCIDVSIDEAQSLYDDGDYLVYDDDEADEAAREYILESLWAFRASFIAECMPESIGDSAVKALEEMQAKLCESANPLIKAMLGDNLDYMIEHAIGVDGRGHFLSSYDGDELEQDGFYIYRVN